LLRCAGAVADLEFAKRQNEKPPFYKALSSSIEKDAVQTWTAQQQITNQRKALKDYF